ncbi:hypothetical protein SAMN04488104_100445 [Algoriphagus faecimaris]|uniref:Uncharacterized protein n=2 Tax=Algoriphagus faecimaris TaxID=686796 RepID=A0A1G6NTA9_9BACT|nr:hypothetical protein SAMN04488104_100445 [Algoriphagus faecimaris]
MQQFYIFIISLGWMVMAHPFFISLTEIRQNPESQRFEISQKIFWDDLEVSLREFYQEEIDFLEPQDAEKLLSQIEKYLLEKNKLWIDGKALELRVLGYEIEEDAAWFYMESNSQPWNSKIRVQNSILIDDFTTQQNIVHVYKGTSRSPSSLLLGKGKEVDELEF